MRVTRARGSATAGATLMALWVGAVGAARADDRSRLMILDLQGRNVDAAVLASVPGMIATEVTKHGDYAVIPLEQVRAAVPEGSRNGACGARCCRQAETPMIASPYDAGGLSPLLRRDSDSSSLIQAMLAILAIFERLTGIQAAPG